MTPARKATIARRLGVNRSTITRAAAAGRLVPIPGQRDWYDLEASVARFDATRGDRPDLTELHAERRPAAPDTAAAPTTPATSDPSAPPSQPSSAPTAAEQGRLPLAPAALAPSPPVERPPVAPPARPIGEPADAAPAATIAGTDRAAVQAQKLAVANAITKLEIALERGHRLLRADVGREARALGLRLQDHLLRVIDQSAARIAATPDPHERRRILARELQRVRRAFDQGGIDSLRALKATARNGAQRGETERDA